MSIPIDLFGVIFNHLPLGDYWRLGATCSRLHTEFLRSIARRSTLVIYRVLVGICKMGRVKSLCTILRFAPPLRDGYKLFEVVWAAVQQGSPVMIETIILRTDFQFNHIFLWETIIKSGNVPAFKIIAGPRYMNFSWPEELLLCAVRSRSYKMFKTMLMYIGVDTSQTASPVSLFTGGDSANTNILNTHRFNSNIRCKTCGSPYCSYLHAWRDYSYVVTSKIPQVHIYNVIDIAVSHSQVKMLSLLLNYAHLCRAELSAIYKSAGKSECADVIRKVARQRKIKL